MNDSEALQLLEKLFVSKPLTKAQALVFCQSWQGKSYLEIANAWDYDYGYIKDTGAELWQRLTMALGQKVTKQNCRLVVMQSVEQWDLSQGPPTLEPGSVPSTSHPLQDWGDAVQVSIFYGREQEVSLLQSLITEQHSRLAD